MGELDLMFELKILTYDYFEGTDWIYEDLSAPFWRLYRHTYSGEWMKMGDGPIVSEPDLFTIIAPYTRVKACGGSRPFHFYIHFVAGYPFNVISGKVFSFKPEKKSLVSVESIQSKISKGKASRTVDSLVCTRLCAEALSHAPWEKWGSVIADKRVMLVDSFMAENIGRAVSNDELSSLAYMAPNSFVRFFKGITGYSPQQYFTRKKIERACFLLQYHDVSIDEVADLLGFGDRYYFSRVFKKVTGAGPASYRKLLKKVD